MDKSSLHEEVFIKQELEDEDEIKTEGGSVNYTSSSEEFVPSLIIEKEMPVCAQCKCAFERTAVVKFHRPGDVYKCNKCILHSRLNAVFNSARRKTRGKVKKINDDSLGEENVTRNPQESVRVKKIMYLCFTCKKPFERKEVMKRHESDWVKCNKCILQSRLSFVFRNSSVKSIKSVNK